MMSVSVTRRHSNGKVASIKPNCNLAKKVLFNYWRLSLYDLQSIAQ